MAWAIKNNEPRREHKFGGYFRGGKKLRNQGSKAENEKMPKEISSKLRIDGMAFKLLKNRKKEWKNSSSSLNISQFKGRLEE